MSSYLFEAIRRISIDILTDMGLYAGNVRGTFGIRVPSRFTIKSIRIEPEYLSDTLMRQALYELIDAAVLDGANYTDENADPHILVIGITFLKSAC